MFGAMKLNHHSKMKEILSLIIAIALLGMVVAGADSAENKSKLALNFLNMSSNISEIATEDDVPMNLLSNATFNLSLYCVDRSLELDKNLHKAYLRKYDLLFQSGRYEEAISFCDKLLDENPLQQDIWYWKGQALDKLARWSEAIECYDRAICCHSLLQGASSDKEEILEGNAWYYKALGHKRMKDNSKALSCFTKSIEIYNCTRVNKNRPIKVWLEMGNVLLEMDRYNDSMSCFEKVISKMDKSAPYSANAYRGMGLAQLLLAKNQSGKKGHDQSADYYEQSNISYGNAIRAFEFQNDNKSAWTAYFGKWVALRSLSGKDKDSRAAFNKAVELARGKVIPYPEWIGKYLQWIFEKAKEALDYAKSRTA
jgi:tetratricopeptide (TPR) repeat protein